MVEKTEESKKFMKAVILKNEKEWGYAADVKEIPTPGKGQVLIKVEAAPINPTDTYFMRKMYNGEYQYPLIPGTEGSGTVIQSGGGFYAWTM